VRYEDLVAAPEETLARALAFLEVEHDLSILERAFENGRTEIGPGDHKMMFTSRIETTSIGHGKRLPIAMIPPPLLEAVNTKLEILGYEPLSEGWNAELAAPRTGNGNVWSARLVELMGDADLSTSRPGRIGGNFAVVAEDHEGLRWVIDPQAGDIRQGDGEVEIVVTGTAQDLVLMISNEQNLGALMRSGRIRHISARADVPPGEVAEAMRGILDVLQASAPVGQGAAPGIR
jgi:hypothetical protein